MTDGPTGIQVAPITEDDMNKVTSILKRAADAIVGMSQLAADVDMLRQTVASLQADCDRLRNQNNALDEALSHSRSVRDEQARELAQTKDQLSQVTRDRDLSHNDFLAERGKTDDLQAKLIQATHERDQWADEADKLTRSLEEAHNKLEAIRSAHEKAFGADKAQAVQATPTTTMIEAPTAPGSNLVQASAPEPIAASDPWRSEPSPQVNPYPTPQEMNQPESPTPSAPTRTYHGSAWEPGYLWDGERQQYYSEA